jgi:hypothetical protein
MPGQSAVAAAAIACLIVLHTPDREEIAVDTRQILMLRPVTHIKEHFARGTNTLVYISGQRVAVTELPHEVEYLTKICEDGAR